MNKTRILVPAFGIYFSIMFLLYLNKFLTPTKPNINGVIDGCCCEVDMLKSTNSEIEPDLNNLSNTLFFKIFKVDLEFECPFWAQQLLCADGTKCFVGTCKEDEIPQTWIQNKTDFVFLENHDIVKNWEESSQIIYSEEWFAQEKNGVYVNLKLNQEAYTGYQGQKIWSVIYGENCFQGDENDMCMEEKMFNRLISGLHSSISTHLSEYYFEEGKKNSKPNIGLYFQKVGDFPDRIQNLYFLYSVLLRAINLASNHINEFTIDTGDFKNDIKSKELLVQILNKTKHYCDFPIKEKEIFADSSKIEIRKQFQSYFYNISRIMDCVECEKCKVYGKMQTLGIGTALKILFSMKDKNKLPSLRRNELIALINTFNKISTSIKLVDLMFERRILYKHNIIVTIGAVGIVFIFFLYIVMRAWEDLDDKLKRKFRIAGCIEKKHLKRD